MTDPRYARRTVGGYQATGRPLRVPEGEGFFAPTEPTAARAQPFRHKVQLVQAWRCVDCGGLFHPDWPSDDESCPAHEDNE